jgi:tetratricopeptide (TPR) repeat protein
MLAVLGLGVALILAYAIYSSRRSNYGHSHQEVVEAHKYHLTGNDKHSQQDIEGALEDYEAGLEIAPRYVPLLLARANLYMQIGEFDSALYDCSRALDIDPQHNETRYQRAKAYEKIGKLGEALADYSFLIEKYDDASAYVLRIELLLRLKQYDKALQDAQAALEKHIDKWFGHVYLGRVYKERKEYKKAISELTLALGVKTISTDRRYWTLFWRCWSYYATKQIDKGLADAETMVVLSSELSSGQYALGYGLTQQGQYSHAVLHLQQARRLEPDNTEILYRLGKTYEKLHRHEKAIETFAEHVRIKPEDETGYLHRGMIYAHLEQYANAIADYTQILGLDENHSLAYNNRSWAKAAAGDYQGSLEDANKAIEIETEHAHIYSTRGQAYWLLQNYQSALADFEHAQQLAPEQASYLAETAVAQFALQQNDEAIQLWQQIQAMSDKPVTAAELQTEYGWAQPFYEAMQQIESLAKAK